MLTLNYYYISLSQKSFVLQVAAMWLALERRMSVSVRRLSAIKCAAVLMSLVGIFLIALLHLPWPRPKLFAMNSITTSQGVDVSNTEEFRGKNIHYFHQLKTAVDVNSFRCVRANISGITFPICVHRAKEDTVVSAGFIRGDYFEHRNVERFIDLIRRYPDFEFIDLGANLGTFSLPIARITHVVAVEPCSKTMARLFQSVKLGGVEKNVSLVFNAISNARYTSALGVHPGNFGGIYLTRNKATDCQHRSCTQTILLDDLLPLMRRRRAVMKVDIELHQPRVFTNIAAAKFFELIDIPIIFMEWKLCRPNVSLEVRGLIIFFTSRQYKMISEFNQPLGPDCSKWTNNIIFKKQPLEF